MGGGKERERVSFSLCIKHWVWWGGGGGDGVVLFYNNTVELSLKYAEKANIHYTPENLLQSIVWIIFTHVHSTPTRT